MPSLALLFLSDGRGSFESCQTTIWILLWIIPSSLIHQLPETIEDSMERFGQMRVICKRVKIEAGRQDPLLDKGSTPMVPRIGSCADIECESEVNLNEMGNKLEKLSIEGNTPKLSQCLISLLMITGSETSRNSLAIPNEVLVIILRHIFGSRLRAFLSGRDPTTIRLMGDLSALDASMQFRQVALSILFENIKVIGQDLLAGPIRELSPGYFHRISALTIGCESVELFKDFEQGPKLFTGLKSLHLEVYLQVPENYEHRARRARNRSYYSRIIRCFRGKADVIKNLLEKYSGNITPKLALQITQSQYNGMVSIFWII